MINENDELLIQVKNYWDNQPCNVNHSRLEIGTMEYYEEVEKRKYFVEPHIPIFAQFEKYRNKNVLEIGCGIGTDAINFAKSGANYTGIDISNTSLDIAKDRFQKYGLSGNLLVGNAERLEELFDNADFDLIYSFGVLHHTPKIENALKSIWKISKPNTEIKLMLYAKNSYKQILIDENLMQPEAQFGCPIARSFSQDEVLELLSQNLFKVFSIEQCHIFPYEIGSYRQYEYKKLKWFEVMPTEIFQALEKKLGWHLLIKASAIK